MQTILGANGTIGTLLAMELTDYTDSIRLVSRNPKKVNEKDELFPADLSDPLQVDKAIEGSSVVYLLVGFEYKINVWREKWPRLMRATLDACIKHGSKLVFFDNMYLYDKAAMSYMTEDSPVLPPSEKGKVRQQIADMLLHDTKSGKLEALIARSADFYGPRNEKSVLQEMAYKNLKKGKRPNWMIDADKIHSFTYTPDAARAVAILGNTATAYKQVWHLPTSSEPITARKMIDLFNQEMGMSKKVSVIPMWMLKILGIFIPILREMPEMMYQNDRDYFFDSSKFNRQFSFTPTSYEAGVRETVKAG
ncbi:MAG: NAD-dependent epimerase/dehydratase family protein [Terrimonas sp.]|nr:NAD-dependent epimerase/dehydratase family protein [Terrimonas sp.]